MTSPAAVDDRPYHHRIPTAWELTSTEPRDWYFTFGHGHRGVAISAARLDPQARGFRLDDRYVVIHGTYISARDRMLEVFGQVWSRQCASADEAGVDDYGLTELVITEGEPRR